MDIIIFTSLLLAHSFAVPLLSLMVIALCPIPTLILTQTNGSAQSLDPRYTISLCYSRLQRVILRLICALVKCYCPNLVMLVLG